MAPTCEAVQHELSVIDESGDTKVMWDPTREAEVKNAKKTFNDMKDKGYVAYKVDKKGEKGSVMDTFDPEAEKIIMAPQLQGG